MGINKLKASFVPKRPYDKAYGIDYLDIHHSEASSSFDRMLLTSLCSCQHIKWLKDANSSCTHPSFLEKWRTTCIKIHPHDRIWIFKKLTLLGKSLKKGAKLRICIYGKTLTDGTKMDCVSVPTITACMQVWKDPRERNTHILNEINLNKETKKENKTRQKRIMISMIVSTSRCKFTPFMAS